MVRGEVRRRQVVGGNTGAGKLGPEDLSLAQRVFKLRLQPLHRQVQPLVQRFHRHVRPNHLLLTLPQTKDAGK